MIVAHLVHQRPVLLARNAGAVEPVLLLQTLLQNTTIKIVHVVQATTGDYVVVNSYTFLSSLPEWKKIGP